MSEPTRLGDPHLGRAFKNGVPLNRKGDREKSQWEDFETSIRSSTGLHICVGDLFDTLAVPYEVVLRAARVYKAEARKHPSNTYVIIRGNHDGSRIAGVVSAYEVFAELLRDVSNVVVLEDAPHIEGRRLFLPWHPFTGAKEMLAPYSKQSFDEVYGHWDVRDFGNENPNLIPLDIIRNITGRCYTGHEHKPSVAKHGKFQLIQTGSMQPYAHGEEAEPSKYLTLTLKELSDLKVPTHDLCLRLRLHAGEVPPDGLDCLQLQLQPIIQGPDGNEIAEVKVEDFDLKTLFDEACDEHEVGEPTRKEVWKDFGAER